MKRPKLRVAAALWRRPSKEQRGEQLLIAQRQEGKRYAGLWELPGGKQELGERAPKALARECVEELGVEVEVGPEWARVTYVETEFTLEMRIFEVRSDAKPMGREGQELRWVNADELASLPMPPADELFRERLVRELRLAEPPSLWAQTFLFASGVGERVERALWTSGVGCQQDALTRGDDLASAEVISVAQAALLRRDLERVDGASFETLWDQVPSRHHWRLLEAFHGPIAALDFECDHEGQATVFSVAVTGQPTEVYLPAPLIALFRHEAPRLMPGRYCEGEGFSTLDGEAIRLLPWSREEPVLDPNQLLLVFGGKRFDLGLLRQVRPDESEPRFVYDLLELSRRLRLRGGLKVVERSLGILRDDRIASLRGGDAIALWRRVSSGGDQAIWALADLISYNRADAANLLTLLPALLKSSRKRFDLLDWYRRG